MAKPQKANLLQKFLHSASISYFSKTLNDHLKDHWEIVPGTLKTKIYPTMKCKNMTDEVYGYHSVVVYKYIPLDLTEESETKS